MLPLAAVITWRLHSPSIIELKVSLLLFKVEDWLDGERHPWSHFCFTSLGMSMVMDERRHMQLMSDTMASKHLIHMIAVVMRVIFYYLTYFIESLSWFALVDCYKHGLSRDS